MSRPCLRKYRQHVLIAVLLARRPWLDAPSIATSNGRLRYRLI